MKNYDLLNIERRLFDQWLRQLAVEAGAEVWYNSEFTHFLNQDPIKISVQREKKTLTITSNYLIGADGVFSAVRRQLDDAVKVSVQPVLQEYWKAKGDIEACFYAFFRGTISSTYAYIVPKDDLYLIGLGVSKANRDCMTRFKNWLSEEFGFKPRSLMKREAWAIPFGHTYEGRNNIILVGDAAGFCNTLSGEGIRLAIESGVISSHSIQNAQSNTEPLSQLYAKDVEAITSFVNDVHTYTISLNDEGREEFVKTELARL